MKYDPLGDSKSSLELVEHMGNDLSIINAARVSYDNESKEMTAKDLKLLGFLIHHKHTSTLRGVVFTFRVKAPLYVCRQWWKHVIASGNVDEQLQWNERSMRYSEVTDEADYYVPDVFRKQSNTNKQGSQGEVFGQRIAYTQAMNYSWKAYSDMIEAGVCREQARGVLGSGFYTTFVWTVSLHALLNFLDLRSSSNAQREIVLYANCIGREVATVVPNTLRIWYENSVPQLQEFGLGK